MGYYILQNKFVLVSRNVNACLERYDTLFLENDGIALFGSLEEFNKYPDGKENSILLLIL